MGTPGKPLDRQTREQIVRLREHLSLREAAKALQLSTRTVQKYAKASTNRG